MRDQINGDLDSAEVAFKLMSLRASLVALLKDWRSTGGMDRLPSFGERLTARHQYPRKAQRVVKAQ